MSTRERLKITLEDQLHEATSYHSTAYVERSLTKYARPYLVKPVVIVITGIRRCGKSIFSHQLMGDRKYGYINFDDERLSGLEKKDLSLILEVLLEIQPATRALLLDEIQNIEGWELFVNRLQRQGFQVVVTGSNSKLLSRELATHLTGRTISFELSPFSFSEFLNARAMSSDLRDIRTSHDRGQIFKHLSEYFAIGGFPQTVVHGLGGEFLRELFDRILTKDIVFRHSVRFGKALRTLAHHFYANPACRFTLQSLSRTLDLKSVPTIGNYIEFLEEAYLVSVTEPFSFKSAQKIRLPRKCYSPDNGLISAVHPRSDRESALVFENLVYQELARKFQAKRIKTYMDLGVEVDFVVSDGREVSAIVQACYSMHDRETRKRELKALDIASYKLRCKDMTIVTWEEDGVETTAAKPVRVIPYWKWALEK